MAVLNWATVVRDVRGTVLLERNPLKGLSLPVEANPRRAVFTNEQFDALCAVAPTIHPLFRLAVITAYHTGHRIGAIRHLRWSDIDFETNRITWRTAYDKSRREHITPLATDLKAVLQAERRKRLAIGDGWIFPNPKDSETPVPKHVAGDWMTRGLKDIGIKEGERYGYHSIRRQFATSMKTLPLADLCALGGWKDSQTVIRCYMQPDEGTMRAALENRRPVRVAGSQ
jgi:integrase